MYALTANDVSPLHCFRVRSERCLTVAVTSQWMESILSPQSRPLNTRYSPHSLLGAFSALGEKVIGRILEGGGGERRLATFRKSGEVWAFARASTVVAAPDCLVMLSVCRFHASRSSP